jgi:P-type Cu+ transporter
MYSSLRTNPAAQLVLFHTAVDAPYRKSSTAGQLIHVRQGVPLEITFDRQESGECTNRVVFADLGVNAGLPAHTRTTVLLRPDRVGTFGFACGMNMIHGTLIVEPPIPVRGLPGGGEAAHRPVAADR